MSNTKKTKKKKDDGKRIFIVKVQSVYHCKKEDLADLIQQDMAECLMADPLDYAEEVEESHPEIQEFLKDGGTFGDTDLLDGDGEEGEEE